MSESITFIASQVDQPAEPEPEPQTQERVKSSERPYIGHALRCSTLDDLHIVMRAKVELAEPAPEPVTTAGWRPAAPGEAGYPGLLDSTLLHEAVIGQTPVAGQTARSPGSMGPYARGPFS